MFVHYGVITVAIHLVNFNKMLRSETRHLSPAVFPAWPLH